MTQRHHQNEGPLLADFAHVANHDGFDDALGQSVSNLYRMGIHDEFTASIIRDRARSLRVKEMFGQLMPFRKPRLHEGDLVLGYGYDRQAVRIWCHWLGAGLLIVSNTGGGKSNLVSFLVGQIMTTGRNVWMVEMYKSQLRNLGPILRRRGIDLIILRAQDWRFNILQAFTRDPRTHLSIVVDLLVRLLQLPPRSRTILNQGVYGLYEKFGIWNGRTDRWPCLYDLYSWVRATPNLNIPARDAILDRLGGLLLALGWKCAGYRYAWSPMDLARYSIVFEMRGASETVKQVLLEPTLFSLFLHEIERGVVNRPMDLLVMLDDAQRLLDSSQQNASGEIAPMDELAGIIRGSAKSLGITVQTTYGFSRRQLPNQATKFCGRLGSPDDFTFFAANFALTPQQLDWIRLHLTPGTFVGQVSEGNSREPFIFRVPLLNIPSAVTDKDAADSAKALAHLRVIPADEYRNWHPEHLIEVSGNTTSRRDLLSEVEVRFLNAVIDAPGKPSSFYARRARLNGTSATAMRVRLVTLGYLREHQVTTGQRGRSSIVLQPLAKALAAASGKSQGNQS